MDLTGGLITGGLSLLGGLLGGDSGSQNVSSTTTNEWRTPAQQQDAARLWDDFINSFYGVTTPASGTSGGTSGGTNLQSLRGQPISVWPSDIAVAYSNHMRRLGYPDNASNRNEFLGKYETYLQTGELPQFQCASGIMGCIPSDYNPFDSITTGTGTGTGTSGEGETTVKSYLQRLQEDQDYLKTLEEKYNTDMGDVSSQYMDETRSAVSPYQALLSQQLNQAQTGTGNFTPISFGFGGKQMASFVPKMGRDLSTQMLGMGKEQMGLGTGLAELAQNETKAILERGLQTGQSFTPNQVQNLYSQELERLAMQMSGGQSTTTASGSVPGESTWSKILEGLNTGANVYRSIYPWQTSGGTTTE